ncbi:hypothetical protein [Novosphingobium sp. MMS21-SN21R]|uniref:hypothetical protein n=1 Tax=Novosphingobium sp. MMS21-SN21R TaxID=2969298 RepID=UPI0028889EC4|nr:hypothetical protein [Novosphingobium sp. MMS21-SN21R]MDT0509039.1 hypothetical protein [Novosphingobium sp. MMS21-SN21R]
MKLIKAVAIILGMMLPTTAFAEADVEQQAQVEALSQCLSMKSTGSDRIVFAGWFVSSMASAPQLKGLADVSPERRDELDRGLAQIFTRLITVDCKVVARPLLKPGNLQAFSSAFEVFGRLAVQELAGDPETDRAMGAFAKYINQSDFADLAK